MKKTADISAGELWESPAGQRVVIIDANAKGRTGPIVIFRAGGVGPEQAAAKEMFVELYTMLPWVIRPKAAKAEAS